jgi:hypothetical protein
VAYEYGSGAAAARLERKELPPGHERAPPIFSPRRTRHAETPPTPSPFPEIDCIRGLLPEGLIAWAERRAARVGVGADHVLISADAITEEAYLVALAASLRVRYERLDTVSRDACPLNDDELIQAAAAGLLPLRDGNDILWLVAPNCFSARHLADRRLPRPEFLRRFGFTSSERLRNFAAAHTQGALGRRAAEGLHRAGPLLSNAPHVLRRPKFVALALVALAAALLVVAPTATITAFSTTLCIIFLASAALRVWSALIGGDPPSDATRVRDDRLPIFTIICALYHEAPVVEGLIAYIRALDYPREKLDVKFVLEADDDETIGALAGLDLGHPFEVITAPDVGPRTKPKALNVALPFARGRFTVIYDAEDRPEPDQLRRAFAAFEAGGDRLACVQARLTIDNTADGWLARGIMAQTPQALNPSCT